MDRGQLSSIPVPEPEPAHTAQQQPEGTDEIDFGITELQSISAPLPPISHILTKGLPDERWHSPMRKFWRHQIRISVPYKDCRDHLANERTFLGYLRTSVALSILGITIAQLYRLSHDPSPNPIFGYYVLAKPLGVIFQCSALAVVFLGGYRYWRQQHAMARGKAYVRGVEMAVFSFYMFMLMLTLFALHVGIPAYKGTVHSQGRFSRPRLVIEWLVKH